MADKTDQELTNDIVTGLEFLRAKIVLKTGLKIEQLLDDNSHYISAEQIDAIRQWVESPVTQVQK